MLIVGDIGGTKANLALIEDGRIVKEDKFLCEHFQDFSEILEKFIDRPVQRACLALAGPVEDRMCQMTNLSWKIDAAALEKRHKIPRVDLLNDLEAAGWGLRRLGPQDLETLNVGRKQSGNQAILAAGTGLGMAGLYWDGKRHHPFASEGGHADFAPRDAQERELWQYLHEKFGHVSVEHVVSGMGVKQLYNFRGNQSPEVLEWFATLYGAAAGNVALQFLTRGGLYLAGGIAPKIVKELQNGGFMKAFVDKGRFESLLKQIPVHVVLNESLPLLGAWEYGLQASD